MLLFFTKRTPYLDLLQPRRERLKRQLVTVARNDIDPMRQQECQRRGGFLRADGRVGAFVQHDRGDWDALGASRKAAAVKVWLIVPR